MYCFLASIIKYRKQVIRVTILILVCCRILNASEVKSNRTIVMNGKEYRIDIQKWNAPLWNWTRVFAII